MEAACRGGCPLRITRHSPRAEGRLAEACAGRRRARYSASRRTPVAVALLNKNLTAGHFDGQIFYESNSVFKQLDQSFPDEAMTWLRERLATGSDRAAGIAAYELSVTEISPIRRSFKPSAASAQSMERT